MNKIPQHIWIIMDWNRRWAKKNWLLQILWHKAWAENVDKIVEYADELWIKFLTLWWLSKDNLNKRDKNEINSIIKLINNIEKYLSKMLEKWLKFEVIWDIKKLPQKSQLILDKITQKTKNNLWITLILALVYNWRDEIERAYIKAEENWILPKQLLDWWIRNFLDSWKYPDLDLIIRTAWDTRHSWFMLYLSEYAEYYYTNIFWPDFDKREFDKAINSYKLRNRRFWWN